MVHTHFINDWAMGKTYLDEREILCFIIKCFCETINKITLIHFLQLNLQMCNVIYLIMPLEPTFYGYFQTGSNIYREFPVNIRMLYKFLKSL